MPVQRPLASQIFARIQRRKQELLPDLVHLFADDADDLVDRALPEKQVRVKPGAQLTDVSRSEEELMACDFGVCRCFAKCGYKDF